MISRVTPAPAEIVFVNVAPAWGLRFHLGAEIEPLGSQPAVTARLESIAEESAEGETSQLYVVRRGEADNFRDLARTAGRPAREIGRTDGRALFVVADPPPQAAR